MQIREAKPSDAAAMLDIYNDVVATSTAIYCDDLADLDYMQGWLSARSAAGYPVFVAIDANGQLLGYSSYGQFRARPGYRFTVEHSVHVSARARGQGVGGKLMAPLISRAREDGYHVMIGAVDGSNEGSLRFHDRLGFTRAGAIEQVGRKFDSWLDVVFVTLRLDSNSD